MVSMPEIHASLGNAQGFFHLRPQECCNHFAWQVGRTDVYPGIFVDLSAKKLAAVGALLADDLRTLGKASVVD